MQIECFEDAVGRLIAGDSLADGESAESLGGLIGEPERNGMIEGDARFLTARPFAGTSPSGSGGIAAIIYILHNSVIWHIFAEIKNPEEERVAARSPVVSEFQKFNSDFYSETFEEKFPVFHLLRIFGF